MKLLLLKPNLLRPEEQESHYDALLYPLLTIASYVDRPDRLRIAIYPDDREYIRESLEWCDAVGVGAYTFEYEAVRQLVLQLRRQHPDKRFFIGGVHPTTLGQYDTQLFDFMVAGEAERVVAQLVDDELAPALRPDGPQCFVADRLLGAEEFPLVRYSYYPFWQRMARDHPIRPSVLSSRGCPFRNCRYCSSVRFDRVFRRMSPDRLVQQFRVHHELLAAEQFHIWDDAFANDPEYLRAFAERLAAAGLRMTDTSCFVRFSDAPLDDGFFRLLKDIGIKVLLPGLETGSQRMMTYLKGKRAQVQHNCANLLAAKRHEFLVLASLMIGNPTETLEDLKDTLRFMQWIYKQRIPAMIWVYVATPLPGSQYWDIALRRGRVRPDMDFSQIDYANFERPFLLDDDIPLATFRAVAAKAREWSERIRQQTFGKNGPV